MKQWVKTNPKVKLKEGRGMAAERQSQPAIRYIPIHSQGILFVFYKAKPPLFSLSLSLYLNFSLFLITKDARQKFWIHRPRRLEPRPLDNVMRRHALSSRRDVTRTGIYTRCNHQHPPFGYYHWRLSLFTWVSKKNKKLTIFQLALTCNLATF